MSAKPEPESYASFEPCGCLAVAGIVQMSSPGVSERGHRDRRNEVANKMRGEIRAGRRVEPLSNEQVRALAWKCADHQAKRDREKAQGKLFDEPPVPEDEQRRMDRRAERLEEKIVGHERSIDRLTDELDE